MFNWIERKMLKHLAEKAVRQGNQDRKLKEAFKYFVVAAEKEYTEDTHNGIRSFLEEKLADTSDIFLPYSVEKPEDRIKHIKPIEEQDRLLVHLDYDTVKVIVTKVDGNTINGITEHGSNKTVEFDIQNVVSNYGTFLV